MMPAMPLLSTAATMSAVSLSMMEEPGYLQPNMTNSASVPSTSFSTGAVIGASGSQLNTGRSGLGCQSPKYFSTILTNSSGSKSPATQMAQLLGT